MKLGKPRQPRIEEMPNQVRYHGQTGTSLRQFVVVACDLSNDRCHLFLEREVSVFDEETAHAPEVDGREEILKIGSGHTDVACVARR